MTPAFDNFYNFGGFGPAIKSQTPKQATLDKFQDKLPERLLEYWQEYGFCGWASGLLWIVNPEDYEDILEEWLKGTPFENNDKYYVIGRTAFGNLLIWGQNSGQSIDITTIYSMLFPTDESERMQRLGADKCIDSFFATISREEIDKNDENDRPLFERAVKELGALEPHEMYGFTPALSLGGSARFENLEKVPVLEYLMFLAELGEKRVMADVVALSNELPHNQ